MRCISFLWHISSFILKSAGVLYFPNINPVWRGWNLSTQQYPSLIHPDAGAWICTTPMKTMPGEIQNFGHSGCRQRNKWTASSERRRLTWLSSLYSTASGRHRSQPFAICTNRNGSRREKHWGFTNEWTFPNGCDFITQAQRKPT